VFVIDYALCKRCFDCVGACPTQGALEIRQEKPMIDVALCSECGVCADACVQGAITRIDGAARYHSPADKAAPAPNGNVPASLPTAFASGLAQCGAWLRSACMGRRSRHQRGRKWPGH
jgi:NAD-dependent dihydropyrimidine dehydrogenase PreA subunit